MIAFMAASTTSCGTIGRRELPVLDEPRGLRAGAPFRLSQDASD